MAQIHPKASTSKPQPSDRDELLAFQAELDDSVSAVKSLVNSWIPTNLGAEWDAPAATASSAFKPRPARLGLGAKAGEREKQDAADRKLREQLLGKGANKRRFDEVAPAAAPQLAGDAHSDSDEGESRTKSVKSRKPTTSTSKLQQTAPTTSTKPAPVSTTSKPSTSISAPTSTATATATPARSSAPAAADPSSKASKNKRKKEREKERLALAKRQKMADSRAEDLAARAAALGKPVEALIAEASPVPSDTISSTLRSPTLSAVDATSPALASPVVPAPVHVATQPKPVEAEAEEGSDEEVDGAGDVSMASVGGGAAGAGDKKKKKRRQKKKKAGTAEAPKPVLDLTPASVAA